MQGEIYKKPRQPRIRSAETKWLVDRLRDAKVGEVIEYKELNELIHENVQKEAYHLLRQARHVVRKEHKIEFDCIVNVGLQRCDDEGVLGHMHKTVRSMRKSAKRGIQISNCVEDLNVLPQGRRAEYLAKQSYFAMIAKSSSDRRQKKIEEYTKNAVEKLDMKQLLIALSD